MNNTTTTGRADGHLFNSCTFPCAGECSEIVKQAPTGRWYITMGHAGFNSSANNRAGYATQQAAMRAHLQYRNGGR